MKTSNFVLLIISFLLLSIGCTKSNDKITEPTEKESTVVEEFGKLQIKNHLIVDKDGDTVVLRGMSLFWSQWGGQFYNKETVKWLRDDWKCTVVRAAMGIESGGYLKNPETEYEKIKTVIEACIDLGIYVIVDWHDHHAEDHLSESKTFFEKVSADYGQHPNLIYEIYNEPLNVSWISTIKPYAEEVIGIIRSNDPDNIIVVGTPNWSQDVDDVITSPLDYENIAYSLHFYSSTHGQFLRDKASKAIKSGLPLFVTEWGMSEANGDGIIDSEELNIWADFMEDNNLSWGNWSLHNKDETSAALKPATTALYGWSEDGLSESGGIIRDYLIKMNSGIFKNINP